MLKVNFTNSILTLIRAELPILLEGSHRVLRDKMLQEFGGRSNTLSSYHVPKHIQEHVDYITPGIKLTPVVKRNVKVKRNPARSFRFPKPPGRMPHVWNGGDRSWKPKASYSLPPDLQGCGLNITPPWYVNR